MFRFRPQLETVEDRAVPAIMMTADHSGHYAPSDSFGGIWVGPPASYSNGEALINQALGHATYDTVVPLRARSAGEEIPQ